MTHLGFSASILFQTYEASKKETKTEAMRYHTNTLLAVRGA